MTTATAAGVTATTADVTTAEDVTAEDMTTTPSVTGGGSIRGPVETVGTDANDCGTGFRGSWRGARWSWGEQGDVHAGGGTGSW